MIIEVQEIAFHRNGVSGEGFHAIRFRHDAGDGVENFIATLFDDPGACAVISLDRIASYGVKFSLNSWRGDHFEEELRRIVSQHDCCAADV